MIVAIHQPNYLPWLGYFHKIARADLFVFLDDVQFSKNGYTNRVQVMGPSGAKWLTQPVSFDFGDPIYRVRPARTGWAAAHAETLRQYYRKAPAFHAVWPDVAAMLDHVSDLTDLAEINIFLVEATCGRLGLGPRFVRASSLGQGLGDGDKRLVGIVSRLAPGGAYLSGRGGAKYQNPDLFADAGIELHYSDFVPSPYDQGGGAFVPGLSVLDAAFRVGWDGARQLIDGHTTC